MADATEMEMVLHELAQLREKVETLERAVTDARGRIGLSMKQQVRCPHCGNRTIAHFESIPDFPFPKTNKLGLVHVDRGRWRNDESAGHLEAFVCTGCGAVELWMSNTSLLEGDGDAEGQFKLLSSEDPTAGPYR